MNTTTKIKTINGNIELSIKNDSNYINDLHHVFFHMVWNEKIIY